MKTYFLYTLLILVTLGCAKNSTNEPSLMLPTLSTMAVSSVSAISFSSGGSITSDGGTAVTARGVCWATSPSPVASGSHTTDGNGTGAFASTIAGLTPATVYYVRAYATNSKGTAYGNELTVTTISNPAKITGFSPANGMSGSTVVITGTNFSAVAANNTVKFGETEAVITNATSTTLNVTVPKQAVSGRITVSVNGATDTSVASFNKIAVASVFAGATGVLGFVDGVGGASRFKYPLGIAIDGSGNMFVADVDNHCIRKITQAGVVTTVAGNGTAGHVDGNGTAARFGSPYDVAIDSHGNLFVTESYDNDIRKITPNGDVTTFAGSGVAGYTNGNGLSAQFNFPWSIAIDANDNLYVGDYNNRRLRKITPTGDVTTFAGNGLQLFQGGDMWAPRDITIDSQGNLYVVGTGNFLAQVLKVTPAGIIAHYTTPPANGDYGWADGPIGVALYKNVRAICIDKNDNLYISDNGYNGNAQFIRKISPSGLVSTVINTTELSPTDGIIADQNENVYITKNYGGIIVKISL